jgi:Secretion system C-terminal sorting domain
MKFVFSLLIIVLIGAAGFAQDIVFSETRFGTDSYDKLLDIVPLESGDVMLLGETADTPSGWPNIYLEKLDSDGQSVWTSSLGTNFWDEPHSLLPLDSGDFLIVGATMNNYSEHYDAFVMKVSSTGSEIWFNTYGGLGSDEGVEIFPAPSGGYLVLGFSRADLFSQAEYFLLHINETGDELETHVFGGARDDMCRAAAQSENGNVLLGGYTHSNGAESQNLLLLLTNETGQLLNDFEYDSADPIIVNDIIALEGGFMVAGAMYFANQTELAHPFILKTNQNGSPLWHQVYLPNQAGEAVSITRNAYGYLVTGYTYTSEQPDGWILQTDDLGNEMWSDTVGNGAWDELSCVATDANGQMWFGGFSYVDATQLYDHLLVSTHGVLNIDLTPSGMPIEIPPGGGTLNFTAQITNVSADPVSFDMWSIAILPNGTEYGPILNHQNLTLEPGFDYTISPTQNVPPGAPAGTYAYVVRVGSLNEFVLSESSFEFSKSSQNRTVNLPQAMGGWSVSNEDAVVSSDDVALPVKTSLSVHPNPFNSMTTISFGLDKQTLVDISIYDILGREVAVIHQGVLIGGVHKFSLDADNFASGVYFVRAVQQDGPSITHKLLVLQ